MTWLIRALRAVLVAFYLELPRKNNGEFLPSTSIERTTEKKKTKRQVRKLKKENKKHEWNKKRVKNLPQNRNYLRTSAKDVRFSDQQKIRRMFRNS